MFYSIEAVVWILILLSVTFIFRKWNAYRAFRAATIKYGCQQPQKYPHRDPIWGYDLVEKRKEAVQNGRLMGLYMDHFSQYGKTWEEKFFNTRIINTMEMRNIQQVTALGFQEYGKLPGNWMTPFLGRGIFSHDGAIWKHSRALVKPTFARSELSDIESLKIHVEKLLEVIPTGSTIEIQEPLHKLFHNASTEFLFGKSMDSPNPDDPNSSAQFIKAMNDSLAGAGKRRLWGILSPILFAFDNSWKEAYDKVHAYIDIYVKQALAETEPEISKDDSNSKPQARYVLLHEMAKQIRDPIELRFQILNVFLPARDSTSILVGNSLFHLARNPEIWTQLRAESLALGDQPLTFEVLKSLRYFKYVVHETIRLQGPSGRIQRMATCDTILPVGGGPDGKSPVFVKKGTVVAMNLWGLHHDKDFWGDDVNEFKPQRWANRVLTWEFLPFLSGPRICPGQNQVLTQAAYLLVRMTQAFARIENRDSVLEYVERVKLTTESRNGVKVAFFTS